MELLFFTQENNIIFLTVHPNKYAEIIKYTCYPQYIDNIYFLLIVVKIKKKTNRTVIFYTVTTQENNITFLTVHPNIYADIIMYTSNPQNI